MTNRHTIWFTGLSRSGKTVLAESLAAHLRADGRFVEILDGKLIRDELAGFFGYSKDERIKVSRVLCMMARLLSRHGVIPIVTSITPYQESRDYNREELDMYVEIYVDCSVEICVARDADNLYKRALRGEIRHFIGVDDPYEIPENPDIRICTDQDSQQESAKILCDYVDERLANVRRL